MCACISLVSAHYDAYCAENGIEKLTQSTLLGAIFELAGDKGKPEIRRVKADKTYLLNISLKVKEEKRAKKALITKKEKTKKKA